MEWIYTIVIWKGSNFFLNILWSHDKDDTVCIDAWSGMPPRVVCSFLYLLSYLIIVYQLQSGWIICVVFKEKKITKRKIDFSFRNITRYLIMCRFKLHPLCSDCFFSLRGKHFYFHAIFHIRNQSTKYYKWKPN